MFTIAEIILLREALKIAAARHEAQARFAITRKLAPTAAERDHELKAEQMRRLREKLGAAKARRAA